MRGVAFVPFQTLYLEPSRNGLMRPKRVRGTGFKMINMGELFTHDRIRNPPMDLVPMTPSEIDRFGIEQWDLLFARQSLVAEGAGKCSIVLQVPEITTFESHLIRVRLNPAMADPLFYYYYFQSPAGKGNMQSIVMQVAAAGIRASELATLPVPRPALAQQRRIGSILSAYDDLIENNTRRIAILEEMARRIYDEWFVRFRFLGHEGVRMVESELGLAPEGWAVANVVDLAVVYRGRSYKGSELADVGGRPFVNLKCMDRDGGFRSSGLKRYTGEFKESHTVRPGDMVMGITDMTQERRIVARVGRVSPLDADFGVFSMDLVRIASRGVYPEPYLYAMFRWSGFADEVKQHANGANVLHLLPARIEEFRLICPSPELATRFANLMAPMLALCDTLEQKNANLRETRDLLLPKLISGALDVSAMPEPEALAA